jgi:antitoxin component of RelBE/YafQ-DinJ toxin-antitoxin module
MRQDRLQLRIDARLKEQATRVVKRRHTTLTAVITQFLQQLVESDAMERRVGVRDHEEQV